MNDLKSRVKRFTVLGFFLIAGALSSALPGRRSDAEEAKVNTPTRIMELRGKWELVSVEGKELDGDAFRQTLYLGPQLTGSWHKSQQALPGELAWFVDGNDLRLIYYEHDASFSFPVRTKVLPYRFAGETIMLTVDGKTTQWRRIKSVDSAQP